jgi:DNA polymerase-3 subunit epsilon
MRLPTVIDIRDWTQFKAEHALRLKSLSWPRGELRPVLEVESIYTEKESTMNIEILKCKGLITNHFVILDTETTGLGNDAQIVEIAILDDDGRQLLDTRVRPTCRIPPVSTSIHGITDADVATAPNFAEVWPKIVSIISGKTVIIYNAEFDLRMLRQSASAHHIGTAGTIECRVGWECAMLIYADFRGERDDYHGHSRWWRLDEACLQMRVDRSGIRLHSAAGDAELTRRLIYAMSEGVGNATHP